MKAQQHEYSPLPCKREPDSIAALNTGTRTIAERMKLTLDYDELTNCMRCGFCLPSCPTFIQTGVEAASPRGRIALMKAVVDDMMPADEAFQAQMDLCLGCRACEPACPADVKYGQLIEQTRAAVETGRRHRWRTRLLRHVFLKQLFPHPGRMRLLGLALGLYQRSGLQWLVRRLGLLRLLPKHLRELEWIMPAASARGVVGHMGTTYEAEGTPIGTVGLFRGCIMDVLFVRTHMNTVKLLTKAGFHVVIPPNQSCCGALHAHGGELEQARRLAKHNIQVFREAGIDYIVSNAGGCGALLIEYDQLLKQEAEEIAEWFVERVKDVSELLVEFGRLPQLKATRPIAVTYQDSCHLSNVMKAGNAPRRLLSHADGIHLIEMKDAASCCGSAGIYNLTQPAMSMQLLDAKMEHVKETGAHYILTSNPGCLLQMKLGVERAECAAHVRVEHIVDFIADHLLD